MPGPTRLSPSGEPPDLAGRPALTDCHGARPLASGRLSGPARAGRLGEPCCQRASRKQGRGRGEPVRADLRRLGPFVCARFRSGRPAVICDLRCRRCSSPPGSARLGASSLGSGETLEKRETEQQARIERTMTIRTRGCLSKLGRLAGVSASGVRGLLGAQAASRRGGQVPRWLAYRCVVALLSLFVLWLFRARLSLSHSLTVSLTHSLSLIHARAPALACDAVSERA
jgi:hypothetical protein